MSLTDVLQQLPAFSVSERQTLVRYALELDDPGLAESELAVVESRLDGQKEGVALEQMKSRLRSRCSE